MLRSALSPLERWILVTIGVLTALIILVLVWGDQTVPRVRSFNWDNQVVGVQDRGLILTFNRPMDRESVEDNLAIAPPLKGKFSWAGRRMAYTLEDPIPYGQTFTVSLAQAQDQFKQRSIPIESPFSSQFKSRDQAFVYLGIGEEEHQLILYNLTRQEKQILTPKDLVVVDFEPYPDSDRILFSATDRVQYDQGNFDLQIYSVTTGIDYQQGLKTTESKPSTQDTSGGQVKLLIPSDEYQNLKFDLSPDGKTIVVQRANKKNPGVDFGLWILREGKALEPLKTEPGGDFLITPDSKSMIMAHGHGGFSVIDYGAILTRRYSGNEWILDGDDYKGLNWLSDTPKPTKAALDKLWPEVEAEIAKELRDVARRAAYMEQSDPVFFKWQRGEATEAEWKAAVAAVKAQFPA